jgi:sec-independent protein translocase protein TatB
MEILGIGPSELIFIIIIAIIVLGPKDMQKAGRTLGRWLNQLKTSDGWKAFQATSRELRNLPNKLMREANLDELDKEIRDIDPRPKPPASFRRPSLPQSKKVDSTPPPSSTESNQPSSPETNE